MKTHDYEHAFRGYWDRGNEARCRVRILQRDGSPPIVILTELPDNESTSITNMIERVTLEVIAKHLPHRLEVIDEPPAIVIEHYPPRPGERRGRLDGATYDLVTFGSWRPRMVRHGADNRPSLGEPEWRHMPADEARALLGDEADDLSPVAGQP